MHISPVKDWKKIPLKINIEIKFVGTLGTETCYTSQFETVFQTVFETVFKTVFEKVFETVFETNFTIFETYFTIFETTFGSLMDFTKGQRLWQRMADHFCSCLRPVFEKYLRQFLKHILQFLGQFLRHVVV